MGYDEFAPSPFILPSITPSSFPIKLPDDAGSPLPTLAPDGSPPGRKNDEKQADFEPEMPPFAPAKTLNHRRFLLHLTTFQAIKNRPARPRKSMPINAFCGSFQQRACMKSSTKNPSNEAPRITSFAHAIALERCKTRSKTTIEAANLHHSSPYSSRPGDSQGRLLWSRRGSDFTLDDPQPASTLTRKRQWRKTRHRRFSRPLDQRFFSNKKNLGACWKNGNGDRLPLYTTAGILNQMGIIATISFRNDTAFQA